MQLATNSQQECSIRQLDDALIGLRRILNVPMRDRPAVGERVELSTVLVTDSVHRTQAQDRRAASVADVAERLSVAASTASRLVDRAELARMIHRGTDHADARRTLLYVSPRGRALLQRADSARMGYLQSVLVDWSDADVAALSTLLARFSTDVRHHKPLAHIEEHV